MIEVREPGSEPAVSAQIIICAYSDPAFLHKTAQTLEIKVSETVLFFSRWWVEHIILPPPSSKPTRLGFPGFQFNPLSLQLLTFQHPLSVSDAHSFVVFLQTLLELFSFHLSEL